MTAVAAERSSFNVEDLGGDPLAEMPGGHRPVDDARDHGIDGVVLGEQPGDLGQLVVSHDRIMAPLKPDGVRVAPLPCVRRSC
jgi:hypothetical protein